MTGCCCQPRDDTNKCCTKGKDPRECTEAQIKECHGRKTGEDKS